MIEIFADQHPDVQPHGGDAAVDGPRPPRHRRWNRRGRYRLAGTTGVLGTNVTVDKETRRFDVELFAHIFTNFDQIIVSV